MYVNVNGTVRQSHMAMEDFPAMLDYQRHWASWDADRQMFGRRSKSAQYYLVSICWTIYITDMGLLQSAFIMMNDYSIEFCILIILIDYCISSVNNISFGLCIIYSRAM